MCALSSFALARAPSERTCREFCLVLRHAFCRLDSHWRTGRNLRCQNRRSRPNCCESISSIFCEKRRSGNFRRECSPCRAPPVFEIDFECLHAEQNGLMRPHACLRTTSLTSLQSTNNNFSHHNVADGADCKPTPPHCVVPGSGKYTVHRRSCPVLPRAGHDCKHWHRP